MLRFSCVPQVDGAAAFGARGHIHAARAQVSTEKTIFACVVKPSIGFVLQSG